MQPYTVIGWAETPNQQMVVQLSRSYHAQELMKLCLPGIKPSGVETDSWIFSWTRIPLLMNVIVELIIQTSLL